MVEVIVGEIGKQVKEKHKYFNTYAVNAIQMPNGQVAGNFYGQEPTPESINDCAGISFYIRIEPKATISRPSVQYTSETRNFIAKQRCYLVAFAFEQTKEIDSQKWADRLSRSLIDLNISKLDGEPRIELVEQNANHMDNFFEETKKQFNVTKQFNCIKVTFDLFYNITLTDCEYCDIFKDPC